MKCTKCNKNEAAVFYREVINGKETKYALCPECAAKEEKGIFDPINLFEPFEKGLLGSLFTGNSVQAKRREEKKCTLCGATFRELCEDGKAGCPECYRVFREEFIPTLSRLHGKAVHEGRAPGKFKEKKEAETKLKSLENDLKLAVSEERYEDAASIRDRIRELRG